MTPTPDRGRFVRTALRDLALVQIRHVGRVRYGPAQGRDLVGRVYREMERDFGVLAPPIALHAPAPEALAASWLMLREAMIAPGQAGRLAKEAVATAVSVGNTCPYCVTMHSSMVRSLADGADAAALAGDRAGQVADPALRAIAAWAGAAAARDGATAVPAPFPAAQAPELVGVLVVMQYLNRMVNVFLGDVPLPPGVPKLATGPVAGVLGGLIRGGADRAAQPGGSLDLLPPAGPGQGAFGGPGSDPGSDLAWAAGSPSVAEAFARAGAAIERGGRASVPEPVRALLLAELDAWDGRPRPLHPGWLEEPLAALAPDHRPAGRLALLTALASYRVDRGVVGAFRAGQPQDSALIELAAWAALAAARRVGGWTLPQAGGARSAEPGANSAISEN
ncbi:MAG TPA: carboxymuconolactone decarboxylase family protein [Actinocrinis sp.]|nr:carboxymuconolactone decarboxylase family protein [Actinocrinis sp.]